MFPEIKGFHSFPGITLWMVDQLTFLFFPKKMLQDLFHQNVRFFQGKDLLEVLIRIFVVGA